MTRSRTSDLAERLASAVVEARPRFGRPPVDVEALARELGVESITSAAMLEDGRLEQRGGHTWMLVRGDVWPARRRFTIAHELGHLLLRDAWQEFVAHRTWPTGDRDWSGAREERLCDAFAAALLLPQPWMRREFGLKSQSLETLQTLADTGKVSLAAGILRLRQVLGWKSSLLRWRRGDQGWQLAAATGLPWGLRLTSARRTAPVLEGLAAASTRSVVTLPLVAAGTAVEVEGEVCVRGKGAVALVRLADYMPSPAADPLLARLESLRSDS